jgi:ribosomal protein L15
VLFRSVPCLKSGENGLEDSQEWKETMEEHSVADTDRQELVREARQKDLAQATTEARKSLRGDTGRGQGEVGGTGTSGGKGHPNVVRGARDGDADPTGRHGETRSSHAETPTSRRSWSAGWSTVS